MGYGLMVIFGVIVLAVILVAFVRGGAKRPPGGKLPPRDDVTVAEPAAETINPAESSTASPDQAEKARRHTPPG